MTADDKQFYDWWIEALRSGKYKQGKSFLNQKEGEDNLLCCMGVGCEVAIEHKVLAIEKLEYDKHHFTYDGMSHHPPSKLIRLIVSVPTVSTGTLITMNDEFEKSFSQIADYLQEQLSRQTDVKENPGNGQ